MARSRSKTSTARQPAPRGTPPGPVADAPVAHPRRPSRPLLIVSIVLTGLWLLFLVVTAFRAGGG